MSLALTTSISIVLQACSRLLVGVHLLLELHSGLQVRMSLLCVLCKIDYLTMVVRRSLMLRQVLS